MKRPLSSSLTRGFAQLTLATMLALSVLGAGCKLKKDLKDQEAAALSDAKAAKDAADRAAADAERSRLQSEQTAATLEAAKQKLRSRIALYQALAGDYDGTYIGNRSAVVNANVHVYAANVPTPAELDQITREDEARSRVETITLNVSTNEVIASDHRFFITCEGTGLKPDFAQGQLRFECTGSQGASGRRTYVLSFDTGDLRAMANETPETSQSISAEIGNNLVSGQQTSLGGLRFSLTVNADYTYKFNGSLSRRAAR